MDESIYYFEEAVSTSRENEGVSCPGPLPCRLISASVDLILFSLSTCEQWQTCWVYSECEKFLVSLNFALGLAYLRKGGMDVSNGFGEVERMGVCMFNYMWGREVSLRNVVGVWSSYVGYSRKYFCSSVGVTHWSSYRHYYKFIYSASKIFQNLPQSPKHDISRIA